ncbi:hypothetical protein KEM55_003341 [Ascosphaera atra]|nr:hypothetical protein KEM55_003341 [Ascosphaera atra]
MTPTLNNISAESQHQGQEQPKKKCIAKGEEVDESRRVETKRQRVEKAQTTLRRPFKSPFKCPLKKPIEKGEVERSSEGEEHIQDRANRILQSEQAKRIEAQQQDEQLNKLIVLWRGVAQKAAEEVFEGAKKRVDAMGGVKAWREKMNEKQNSFQAWDTYVVESAEWGGGSEAGSEVDGEDTYQRNARVEDASKENESRSGALQVDDEEEFTMGMMLKILNVDLKVIGFDKDGQKWT